MVARSETGKNRTGEYLEGTIVPMVDLEISGDCNLHCPTCWGTPPDMDQKYGLDAWLSLLRILKKDYGLESIALTGGESLLVPGIDGFIKQAREENGLNLNLLTNGILLEEHFSQIRSFLSSISIPLDGSTEEVNRKTRGTGHYKIAVDWISRLSHYNPDLPLKVGTVISSANINDAVNIGELLLTLGFGNSSDNTWKLYQATAFGAQQESPSWKSRRIIETDFGQLIRDVALRFQGQINVTSLSTPESGGYCIILRPNGNVVTNSKIDGREHLLAPNIFEDTKGAMKSIAEYHVATRGGAENDYFLFFAGPPLKHKGSSGWTCSDNGISKTGIFGSMLLMQSTTNWALF